MIIIWGTKKMTKQITQNGPFSCTHCLQPSMFSVVRVATWFTIFWIPIFPFSFKYFNQCPVCGQMYPLSKEEGKALAQAAKAQQQ